eukprot:UN25273
MPQARINEPRKPRAGHKNMFNYELHSKPKTSHQPTTNIQPNHEIKPVNIGRPTVKETNKSSEEVVPVQPTTNYTNSTAPKPSHADYAKLNVTKAPKYGTDYTPHNPIRNHRPSKSMELPTGDNRLATQTPIEPYEYIEDGVVGGHPKKENGGKKETQVRPKSVGSAMGWKAEFELHKSKITPNRVMIHRHANGGTGQTHQKQSDAGPIKLSKSARNQLLTKRDNGREYHIPQPRATHYNPEPRHPNYTSAPQTDPLLIGQKHEQHVPVDSRVIGMVKHALEDAGKDNKARQFVTLSEKNPTLVRVDTTTKKQLKKAIVNAGRPTGGYNQTYNQQKIYTVTNDAQALTDACRPFNLDADRLSRHCGRDIVIVEVDSRRELAKVSA